MAILINPYRFTVAPIQLETLSGCVFAIDTSRSTITESSNAISQINDLSSGAHHVAQSTAAKKPTKNTDSTSGLVAASFDGGDVLEATDHADLDLSGNLTIYVAADFTTMPAYGYVLSKSSTADTAYFIYVSGTGTALRFGINGATAQIAATTFTGRHVIACTYDSSLGSQNLKTWWDGAAAGTANWGTSPTNTSNTLCIGAARSIADYSVTANFFEVALYNQTHSSTTVTDTCSKLKTKWSTT